MSISRYWLQEVLPYFLKLQHFIIQDCVSKDIGWNNLQTAPECISSQLKTCCIRGYKDTIYEFEFLKYIIQHSEVLETMTIECSTCLLRDQKDQMVLKLSSWARDSTTCELLFD
ncbi:unnamed protein product [Trifolium pratense]|uniref:Uncharacterized protein n=1 Tax=Trifolium pratense TaxID=57577 RepID=A0ACB0J3X4_TRIPR|nr:unnamed protein product [Trifolium pratense]